MAEVNYHEEIARALEQGATAYTLVPLGMSDLLDEWEDAQAMIEAQNELIRQLQAPVEETPAWEVIA